MLKGSPEFAEAVERTKRNRADAPREYIAIQMVREQLGIEHRPQTEAEFTALTELAETNGAAFEYAKMMALSHLGSCEPLPAPLSTFAAKAFAGIISRPKEGYPRKSDVRDTVICLTVDKVAEFYGIQPTRNSGYDKGQACACTVVAEAFGLRENTVLKLYNNRKKISGVVMGYTISFK